MFMILRSARTLRRYWVLTAISVLSLSIAMALGVLGLSLSNTVLILPPAGAAPDRLVMIYSRAPSEAIGHFSYPDYRYYREHNHVFADIAATPTSVGLNDDKNFEGREVKVVTRPVSENYFAVMGLRPFLGRFLAPGDDHSTGAPAVMTWSCWKRLGSDRHIVGKTVAGRLIVGVTAKEFTGGLYGINGDLFTNLENQGQDSWFTERDERPLVLIARLKPGVRRSQAQAEMTALSGQLASAFPKEDKGRSAVVTRATLLPPDAIPDLEWMTAILMALVLLVLLIACANVANLLLAAAVGRRQEAAIKLALGAQRGRLIREFLKESALLCVAGGALGYGLAAVVAAHFANFTLVFPMWGSVSFAAPLHLDGAVAVFTLALIAIATIATGLAPALYASSPQIAQVLTSEIVIGGARKSFRRNALVVTQVSVCTLVLVGMGLCQRNLYNLRHADPGFSARNLVALNVFAEAEGYNEEARGRELHETLRRAAAALPGVESVTLAWDLPLFGYSQLPVQLPDSSKTLSVAHTVVDSAYFATFGIRLLAGRAFNASDIEKGQPVAVVNHKMAQDFWPGKDPVGKTLMAGKPAHQVLVVGVAADGKYDDIDEPTQPFLYYPLSQNYRGGVSVIARTKGDPKLWVGSFAKAMRGLGLKVMVQPVTFEQWSEFSLLGQRIIAWGVAILSALGLLLAVLGLAGAISYSVGQRKKELGIRVALGARRWQLLRMVLRETALVAGSGVAIGILLGIAATVGFRSQLYGIAPVEWTVLAPIATAMLALSLLIAYLSARPWLSVDPMEAVRHA